MVQILPKFRSNGKETFSIRQPGLGPDYSEFIKVFLYKVLRGIKLLFTFMWMEISFTFMTLFECYKVFLKVCWNWGEILPIWQPKLVFCPTTMNLFIKFLNGNYLVLCEFFFVESTKCMVLQFVSINIFLLKFLKVKNAIL